MIVESTTSVAEALALFRATNDVPANSATAAHWFFGLGPLRIHLPNFQWRRRAVERHDLHHILTGYPCSIRGEFQMAAWEFAAGRYPHAGATAICLPLIAGGAIFTPRSLWRAFADGRRARSLYAIELSDRLRHGPLDALVLQVGLAGTPVPTRADRMAFARLVAWALSTALPVLIGASVLLYLAWSAA
jgi:hypothetical protein